MQLLTSGRTRFSPSSEFESDRILVLFHLDSPDSGYLAAVGIELPPIVDNRSRIGPMRVHIGPDEAACVKQTSDLTRILLRYSPVY
jgi:hypothetical protein